MAIPISGTLEPAGPFPLVEAASVAVEDDKRLDVYLSERESNLNGLMNTALTQMASMMATDQALAKADAELAGQISTHGTEITALKAKDTSISAQITALGQKDTALDQQIEALSQADQALVKADEALAKRTKAVEDTLAEFSVSYPIETSGTELQPETYYVFGSVDSLSVTLVDPNDGKVHEYCFEFKPTTDKFTLNVSPNVTWAGEPQYPEGKTCQVSILRGIGVMVCA